MELVGVLAPFVLLGIAVIFIGFSGGPGAAREAYLTRGRRAFRVAIPLIYVGLGIVVPAVVIANRQAGAGGTPQLRDTALEGELERGKELFLQSCASCHTLAAVNGRGVTGPNLDEIGVNGNAKRVLDAIRRGGTGQGRMPADLLGGDNAEAVARFVARTAGR